MKKPEEINGTQFVKKKDKQSNNYPRCLSNSNYTYIIRQKQTKEHKNDKLTKHTHKGLVHKHTDKQTYRQIKQTDKNKNRNWKEDKNELLSGFWQHGTWSIFFNCFLFCSLSVYVPSLSFCLLPLFTLSLFLCLCLCSICFFLSSSYLCVMFPFGFVFVDVKYVYFCNFIFVHYIYFYLYQICSCIIFFLSFHFNNLSVFPFHKFVFIYRMYVFSFYICRSQCMPSQNMSYHGNDWLIPCIEEITVLRVQ